MSIAIAEAASATPGVDQAVSFVDTFNSVILFPLITLLVAVALLVFMYGSLQYILNAENSTAREEGRRHIMWGIIGLLVMLTAFAILSVAANTFGVQQVLKCAKNPNANGCHGTVITLPATS